MALTPGTRLGIYEVAAQIGEGGMGQVFRATDTKLKRQVAIKILPPSLAADPDRLARFQREAEVLASLNHPHIAGIYGLEESDGISALVMELVDGEDLSQRNARGAMPIDEALPIAKQIADALEAAHEQGIIHRDLKPANIKVRADGTVKVLDFGLAKAMDVGPGGANGPDRLSMSPTISMHATQAGIILGTAAYMAPEQARGKAVDKRADIWAFGVVLFEMLTGSRPFPGDDISHVLARVIEREPDWSALPSALSPALGTYLRRCLAKDPRERIRDIGDVRLALTGAFETASPNSTNPQSAIPKPASAWRHPLPWAVAAAAVAVATVLMLWVPWRAEKPVDRPLVRLEVDLGADVSLPALSVAGSHVAISPDGSRLVYASGTPSKLYTRRLDQSKATELPGTEGALGPFFSPDGQWVAFVARGKLHKISVEGGAAVPVGDAATFVGGSWGEDGNIILGGGSASKGLLRIPADGGAPETIAPLASEDAALARPQVLPGGKAVLFTTPVSGDIGNFNVEVLTLADHHRKIVARGGSTARYLPTSTGLGHLVYTDHTTLFAIPFDLEKLETRGTPIPVLDDVGYFVTLGAGGFDVSGTGTLVYRRVGASVAAGSTLQWVDAAGRKIPLPAARGVYSSVRLSPDGTRVALLSGVGVSDVWVYDVQRDAMTRLTSVQGGYWSPIWSPDSQYVVFGASGNAIFASRADGASQPVALTQIKAILTPWSFKPDGTRLAYFAEAANNSQLWTVPLEDKGGQLRAGKPEQFLQSNFADQNPSFSPDGRWMAYHSNESGKNEVYVRPFPPSSGPGGKLQISNSGGIEPRWSRTGHELVYRSGDQIMAASYTVKGDTFVAEKPRIWIAKLGAAAGSVAAWDLAPDGRVVVVTPLESAEAPKQEHEVVFLQNFFDELRRRVPLGK